MFDDVVLINGSMGHGGLATLIVRLSRALIGHGKRVHLFYASEMLLSLPPAVEQFQYSGWRDALNRFEALNRRLGRSARLLVVSLDPTDAALASWLVGRAMGSDGRHISGVFHPRAYFLDGEDWLRFAINRMTLANFRDDQLFFMNEDCRQTHARWARRSFSGTAILPLTIDAADARYAGSGGAGFSVVSVGRLAAFKDYNLEIPRIVHDLRRQGIPIDWQIFGYGELETEIQNRINQFGVEDFVGLRGTLDYARFAEEVAGHDVFVGMGTAALEAAMLGVPTILAVDGQGERTYGFLEAVPFGNVGERQEHDPALKIADLLIELFGKTTSERIAVGHQSRGAALAYSTTDYAAELLRIGAVSSPAIPFWSWLVGMVYRETTIGISRKFANAVVRFGRKLFRLTPRRAPEPIASEVGSTPPA